MRQPYNEIFSHALLTLLRMFVIWQLLSNSSVGHYRTAVQEHECIQKINDEVGSKYHKVRDLHVMVFCL